MGNRTKEIFAVFSCAGAGIFVGAWLAIVIGAPINGYEAAMRNFANIGAVIGFFSGPVIYWTIKNYIKHH